jgi:acyl dehydratase
VTTWNEGEELPARAFRVTRADLVRYTGASGDRNPIHWSDRIARSVGLPGVIAHGMYTLALAARAVDSWAGAPGRVRELGAKFTRPVVVPDDDRGAEVVVAGTVRKVQADPAGRLVTVAMTVTSGEEKVLGMPTASFLVETGEEGSG